METSDGVQTALCQQAEAQVLKLLRNLQQMKKGALKGLEQQVLETVFERGRGWMESSLSDAAPKESTVGQRVGSCGHRQQLVGYRPKQVFTRLRTITCRRAYYPCLLTDGERANGEEAQKSTTSRARQRGTHGAAPADGLWGVQGRHTSAGVRACGELSGGSTDAGGTSADLAPSAAVGHVSAASAQAPPTQRSRPRAAGG